MTADVEKVFRVYTAHTAINSYLGVARHLNGLPLQRSWVRDRARTFAMADWNPAILQVSLGYPVVFMTAIFH